LGKGEFVLRGPSEKKGKSFALEWGCCVRGQKYQSKDVEKKKKREKFKKRGKSS